MRISKSILVLVMLTVLAACGTSGISTVGNPNGNEDGFEMASGKYAFYSAANDTTPVITASADTSLSVRDLSTELSMKVSTGWESGNPAYEIFNLLREFDNDIHQGVLDMSNLYRVLWEAGEQYDTAAESDQLVDLEETEGEAKQIASPFDFGTTAKEYTHFYEYLSESEDDYSSHAAFKNDDGTTHALLTWVWDGSSEAENAQIGYGVIEGSFNGTTGALELNMVQLVDYVDSDRDYCLRTYVTGNSLTHTFTIKAGKTGTGDGDYTISMLGTGVSESESDSDYFLLKIFDNGNFASDEDGKYYQISSNPSEDDLSALSHLGYDVGDDEVPDANNYAATLDAMTPIAMDKSDHALSIDDFTGGTVALSYE